MACGPGLAAVVASAWPALAAASPRCGGAAAEAARLPAECYLDDRAPRLLERACRLCPPLGEDVVAPDGSLRPGVAAWSAELPEDSGPCLDVSQDGGELSDLSVDIIYSNRGLASSCPIAFWAAYLISMSYSLSTRILDIPEGMNRTADAADFSWSSGFDLHPFPIWSRTRSLGEHIDFVANFMSAHIAICNDVGTTGPVRGKFVPRAAHDKPELRCSARSTDWNMIKRCRARRRQQPYPGARGMVIAGGRLEKFPARQPIRLEDIRCPTAAEQEAFAQRRTRQLGEEWAQRTAPAVRKYQGRSTGSHDGRPGRGCEAPASEWREDLRIYHKCVLVVVMERLHLPPGSLVLDWGTGCGHKLAWAAQLFDVDGLGIDIVEDNINWARRYSIGRFCALDGRFVEWLPDGAFDAVMSYAALSHLHPDDQCRVVVELVGKVRVGGRLWFGWNSPGIFASTELLTHLEFDRESFWADCFATAARQNELWVSGELSAWWETILEAHLFPDDMTAVDTYLYYPPAYSLFVTRLPGDPGR